VLFSVSADVVTWAAVPEYRDTPGGLRALVIAGLAFNVLAAAVNAVLFAAAVAPVSLAARQAGVLAGADASDAGPGGKGSTRSTG
jgi:hypothetical protein